mgnify:CR=1 FL=1
MDKAEPPDQQVANRKKPIGARTKKGRFAKGKSGNPSGRPKTEITELRAKLAKDGHAVAKVVLDAALSGDLTACKLVLERLLPPLKSTTAPVSVEIPKDAGLTDSGRAILAAITGGDLPPDIGAQLITALGGLARVSEIDELEKRLAALEGLNHE